MDAGGMDRQHKTVEVPPALFQRPSPRAHEITIPAIDADGRRYPIEKMAAHRSGVLHDAVSIFVFDSDRLLIQKRAAGKYHCSGLWANTCCSHPNWGETAADAAARRLEEELGFSTLLTYRRTLEYRADVGAGLIEHERVQVFTAVVRQDELSVRPAPEEVAEFSWAPVETLWEKAKTAPDEFAPWFRIYLDRYPTLCF